MSNALRFLIDYFFLEQPSLPLENSLNFQTKPNATETLQSPRIKQHYIPKKAFDFRNSRVNIHQQHPSLPPVDALKWTPAGWGCHVLRPSRLSCSLTFSLHTSIRFSDCTYWPGSESPQRSQIIRQELYMEAKKKKKKYLCSKLVSLTPSIWRWYIRIFVRFW